MHISETQNKDRILAGVISISVGALLLLFLILYTIVTPIPPFDIQGESGMEMNFGTYNEGTGEVEENGIGDATSVVNVTETTNASNSEKTEELATAENSEEVAIKNDKPKVENNNTTVIPVKNNANESQETTNPLLANYVKNKNKSGNSGGDGNSGNPGNEGVPDGNPNTDGNGGIGNDPYHTGTGPGGNGINLSGRKVVNLPCKVNDSKEEGTVVVIITVDKQGNVVEADPNGRGTTTSSAVLKSKARQAAFCAKFTHSDKYDVQKGLMTFKFEF
jgi:outer membrane biosynthesis protein TonB